MDQRRAPLFERLREYARSRPASFHVPGHKNGQGADRESKTWFEPLMAMDATELPGLDDLHHPQGVIRDAQRLAAACFGAQETFFLVGGSTAGNLAAIMAACDEQDLMLVQRNAHKSVIHGLQLAGAQVVFLQPERCPLTGLAGGVSADTVEQALLRFPQAKGLLLTAPTYFGMSCDLRESIQAAHRRDLPVIVDEAHGAHYGFHPALPQNALACGADAVIQSTHKMLTSMTMTAMLHVQGGRFPRRRAARYLSMLQSSSPSYPLMASLDLARRRMALDGKVLLDNGLQLLDNFLNQIRELPQFEVVQGAAVSGWSQDPFKVLLRAKNSRLSGYELSDRLASLGCYVEMALPGAILLVFSPVSSRRETERLLTALRTIGAALPANASDRKRAGDEWINPVPSGTESAQKFSPEPLCFDRKLIRKLEESEHVQVPIAEAQGAVSAEMVIPYPPGIPVLLPGERVEREHVRLIRELAVAGAGFQGMADASGRTIGILKSEGGS